ncbi:hypothetical protein Nepgr_008945 [Nepenthes gracilis]|uniref:Uncharacterized protein n=1 Tax=Nepenthes gracilis TaxID=150966 RepID=A0AAD3SA13_NEPGR|nr:hypothetical protein Nepgr_008945 [Nepenthes gracilis]
MVVAIGLMGFLILKGIQGVFVSEDVRRKEKKALQYKLPQVKAVALLSITLAFPWQKAVRLRPRFMVHFIIWSSFGISLAAKILMICFEKPATNGVRACLVLFDIGNGLYACWVAQRIGFRSKILIKSLEPVSKFCDLNRLTYLMLGARFIWMFLWILAVIGALHFYFPLLIVIALVLSLAWTAPGVVSSIGLGSNLHTFVLYLGLYIAQFTTKAMQSGRSGLETAPYDTIQLKQGPSRFDEDCSKFGSPLFNSLRGKILKASYHGRKGIVELILGFDLIRPHMSMHALVIVCSKGLKDVVDVLLRCGLEANSAERVLLQSSKPSLQTNVDCIALHL